MAAMDVAIGDVLALACRTSVGPLAAFVVSALLRRRSAATRHGVLVGGLVAALLAVPAVTVVPAWGLLTPPVIEAAVDLDAGGSGRTARRVAPASTADGPWPPPRTSVMTDAWRASGSGLPWGSVAVVVWLAGVVLGLGRLCVAGWALRRLRTRAERLTHGAWAEAAADAARRPGGRMLTIYSSPEVASPSTFGVLRPAVVVPESAHRWSTSRVEAVICHEMAHVTRCDWVVHVVADIAVALHWYNPLIHLVRARLQRESEQACDDAVLAAGTAARDYAEHLLAIAHAGRLAVVPAGVVPMAQPSTLERRIAAMLKPELDRRAPSHRTVVAFVCLLLALALPMAGFTLYAQGGPSSVSGVVYDPSGAVLPAVELSLEDDRGVKFSAVTDASGRFEFGPLDSGPYRLQATLAGFRAVRLALTLAPGRNWNSAVTMNLGTLQETITVTARRPSGVRPPTPGTSTPVRVGGNIKVPYKVLHVRPVYPEALREAGLEGTVRLDALIGVDGAVVSARPVSADVHPAFLKAATDAVQQWRFTGTQLNGTPVEVAMEVSIRFGLSD
jgi:TonB family protein